MVDHDGSPDRLKVRHDEPTWRTGRHGSTDDGCVECAVTADAVLLRQSRHPDGPVLSFGHHTWRAFIDAIKAGEFDH